MATEMNDGDPQKGGLLTLKIERRENRRTCFLSNNLIYAASQAI